MKKSVKVIAIVVLVLILDQALKIWVKTNMVYGEFIPMLGLSWAKLHFVENKGMAFGLTLGGEYGKLILSLFRIVAVGFLIYYINKLIKENASLGLLASFALILAGAIGNIIDSAFYGLIFSESPMHGSSIAQLFPSGGGYAGFLHGKVVDMLYFPLIEDKPLPSWFPIWGGENFTFFKPVFNIADSSITIGVLSILVFQRSFFTHHSQDKDEYSSPESELSVKKDGLESPVSYESSDPTEPEDGLPATDDGETPNEEESARKDYSS